MPPTSVAQIRGVAWTGKPPRVNRIIWFEANYCSDLEYPCFAGSGAQFRDFLFPTFFRSRDSQCSAGRMTAPRVISFTPLQSPILPRLGKCPFCQFCAFFTALGCPTLLIYRTWKVGFEVFACRKNHLCESNLMVRTPILQRLWNSLFCWHWRSI